MTSRTSLFAAVLLVIATVASAPGAVLAQEAKPEIVVKVTMFKEVVTRDAAGQRKVELVQAATSNPGDTLVYRISATNEGAAPAHNTRIVDPIPVGTQLIPESWTTAGSDLSVSIDGGKSFQTYPVKRPVKLEDGNVVEKDVELSRYTHLRWTATEPLTPGETRSASFKVTVR